MRVCCHAGGMVKMTVRLDEELALQTKMRALQTGVSVQEVVQRLLQAYVDGSLPALTEGESPFPLGSSSVSAGPESAGSTPARVPRRTATATVSGGGSRPSAEDSSSGSCPRAAYHRKGEFCKSCGVQGD